MSVSGTDAPRAADSGAPDGRLPSWRDLNQDTTPGAEAILFRLWRETPAWRKLERLDALNRAARQLALAGLRRRLPTASPAELRRHLADMLLGPELAERVYGSHGSEEEGRDGRHHT